MSNQVDPEYAKRMSCWFDIDRVPRDPVTTGWKRSARLRQAEWREQRGYPIGHHPHGQPDGTLVGSRVELGFAREKGINFISAAALSAARARVAAPEPHQLLDEPRLFADLLSSMPLCFNLFGDLYGDPERASRAVRTWWPDAPPGAVSLRFEHSPGRRDREFLGTKSAFDVALEIRLDEQKLGLVGVETKYHEHVKREEALDPSTLARCVQVAERSNVFQPGWRSAVDGTDLQQLWLDHLLALSMLQHRSGRWSWVRFVLVYPAGNQSFADAAARYRELLRDDRTFEARTIEELLDVAGVLPDGSVSAFRARYLSTPAGQSSLRGFSEAHRDPLLGMRPQDRAQQLDVEFRSICARLNRDEPYFGRFALRIGEDVKPFRVGAKRVADERIVDWRHPLARAYYEAQPGEEFELDARGFAELSAVVDELATLTTHQRVVKRVAVRSNSGTFELSAGDAGFESPAVASRAVTHVDGLPDVLALITPEQYRLITASRKNAVIIQGRAGSGKTTVALYRVAWLTYAEEDAVEPPVDPSKVLIVMFNKALSSFVRSGLKPLKLEAARLDTFHAWALEEIRRSYRGVVEPDTSSRKGREVAAAIKKQMGTLRALDEFVARQTQALEVWLQDKLEPYGADLWMKRYRQLDMPVARRLVVLRSLALSQRDAARGVEQERLVQVHTVLETAVRRMTQYKEELLKFLTDISLLAKYMPKASSADLQTLAAFQRELQGEGASERRPGAKVTFEDLALLLRLIQLKNGGFPDKSREEDLRVYDHLVIDEAQDFGAVELTVLLASVRARTGVTIVGDSNQKILPDVDFMGWDALARELGVTGAQVTKLEVVHRSTSAIMRVADSILGEDSERGRSGAKPTLTTTRSFEELLQRTAEVTRSAYEENRLGHVCVVCRAASDAPKLQQELAARLQDLDVPVRLGHNRQFEFSPGITVSGSRQVKGLEFETVVVFDPSRAGYPDDLDGRRALYMVVSRAKERLHLVAGQDISTLLDAARQADLLELSSRQTVPPARFTDEDEDPF